MKPRPFALGVLLGFGMVRAVFAAVVLPAAFPPVSDGISPVIRQTLREDGSLYCGEFQSLFVSGRIRVGADRRAELLRATRVFATLCDPRMNFRGLPELAASEDVESRALADVFLLRFLADGMSVLAGDNRSEELSDFAQRIREDFGMVVGHLGSYEPVVEIYAGVLSQARVREVVEEIRRYVREKLDEMGQEPRTSPVGENK